MIEFWLWANEHPFLTFFLGWLLLELVLKSSHIFLKYVSVMFRGWPPQGL